MYFKNTTYENRKQLAVATLYKTLGITLPKSTLHVIVVSRSYAHDGTILYDITFFRHFGPSSRYFFEIMEHEGITDIIIIIITFFYVLDYIK